MAQSRTLLLVTGAHVAGCLAAVSAFCRAFGISQRLLLVHAPLLIAALLAALTAAWAIRVAANQQRAAPYLAAIVPASIITGLLFLYVATFVTNRWMASNFTYSLISLWLTSWWEGQQLLPLSGGVLPTAASAIGLVFVLQIAIWAQALRPFQPRLRRRPLAIVGVLAVIGGYAVFFQQLSWRTSRSDLLGADPILAFLRPHEAVSAAQQAVFARVRLEEPQRRAAYGRLHPFDKRNVIVMVVDSLRADHTQVYGYRRANTPFLSRLVEERTLRRVEMATSTCAETKCGVLSTLFSKTLRHQVPAAFSLFTLLNDQGYDTHFVLAGNHNWQGLREIYSHSQTSYFDGRDSLRYGWNDDRVLVEGLERLVDYQRPSFFLFHLMSVGILGDKQLRYSVYQPAVATLGWQGLLRLGFDRDSAINNYDNGVRQADATIEELFAVLDRKGYLRNSIVVILADHGEALGDRGPRNYGHVTALYQEMIRIPMLIYDPSDVTYGGLAFGTQVDVAPTIVDRLGLPIPDGWEGVSLVRPAAPRQTMHQTTLAMPCFAVVDYADGRTHKYMSCAVGGAEELYDLTHDSSERHNLIQSADARLLSRLRSQLDAWRQ